MGDKLALVPRLDERGALVRHGERCSGVPLASRSRTPLSDVVASTVAELDDRRLQPDRVERSLVVGDGASVLVQPVVHVPSWTPTRLIRWRRPVAGHRPYHVSDTPDAPTIDPEAGSPDHRRVEARLADRRDDHATLGGRQVDDRVAVLVDVDGCFARADTTGWLLERLEHTHRPSDDTSTSSVPSVATPRHRRPGRRDRRSTGHADPGSADRYARPPTPMIDQQPAEADRLPGDLRARSCRHEPVGGGPSTTTSFASSVGGSWRPPRWSAWWRRPSTSCSTSSSPRRRSWPSTLRRRRRHMRRSATRAPPRAQPARSLPEPGHEPSARTCGRPDHRLPHHDPPWGGQYYNSTFHPPAPRPTGPMVRCATRPAA